MDSDLRSDINGVDPPRLFVVVLKNGVKVATVWAAERGWEIDFDPEDDDNRIAVDLSEDVVYIVQLWDGHWTNELIFERSSIPAKELFVPVSEASSVGLDPDELCKIYFERAKD